MSTTGGKEKKKVEIFQAALRMTNMYWDVCEFGGDSYLDLVVHRVILLRFETSVIGKIRERDMGS
jgi:hypothetical protein